MKSYVVVLFCFLKKILCFIYADEKILPQLDSKQNGCSFFIFFKQEEFIVTAHARCTKVGQRNLKVWQTDTATGLQRAQRNLVPIAFLAFLPCEVIEPLWLIYNLTFLDNLRQWMVYCFFPSPSLYYVRLFSSKVMLTGDAATRVATDLTELLLDF